MSNTQKSPHGEIATRCTELESRGCSLKLSGQRPALSGEQMVLAERLARVICHAVGPVVTRRRLSKAMAGLDPELNERLAAKKLRTLPPGSVSPVVTRLVERGVLEVVTP